MGKVNSGDRGFPIVAIGASAGGIQAMNELLKHLPPNTGMGYIYIQHMDPEHVSNLAEIFRRSTGMKVVEATQEIPLEKDTLFIIPPGKDMAVDEGKLTLASRLKDHGIYLPIDKFFFSLASKQKEGAIGVVLSGAASDGSLGLKAIKEAGGFTFAQDESAEFQSMPKAAIAEGVVDKVLSPRQIASELDRLSKETDIVKQVMQHEVQTIADNDESVQAIIQLVRKKVNVDFTHYKINTIKRRILRRMLLHKKADPREYLEFLHQYPKEVELLYHDLLINVTCFFRDLDTHEYLKKTLIPQILKHKPAGQPVRIWVPACSTGEEAYSLAMIISEVLGAEGVNVPVQIFATDLSEPMITKARLGIFSRNDVANIPPKMLQSYFTRIDGSYRVIKSIRDLCVFAPHNIFRDPPFSRIDLISCCNLMIYLDTILQKKVLSIFHYALNPGGYLVLGKSETIGTSAQLFSQLERKFKIYSRKSDHTLRINEQNLRVPEYDSNVPKERAKTGKMNHDFNSDLEKMVDDVLLSKFVPASVVVNQDLEIIHFKGSTGLYLEPSPGKASLNLLKMARPGLAFDLRSAVHKSHKSGEPASKKGLEVRSGDKMLKVSIEVMPLTTEGEEKTFLVIFEEERTPDLKQLKADFTKDKVVKKLEEELASVREDMRSIIEEQQAGNEELQSANEEIVSSNEELQSINEELETSKEELESTNEELMTINTELQMRNEQLSESYEYAEAVFSTIREAIIILDKDLRVKTANNSFYRQFETTEYETEGVLIYELGKGEWDRPEMRDLFNNLLQRRSVVSDMNFKWIGPDKREKRLLLNACKVQQKIHQKEIILLAIEDITDITKFAE
jgi:two-component system, chemotaxis family, CheB/CheR fusion protein